MIPDMILRPKAKNELGRRVFLLTMVGAAITFGASLILPRYNGIVQLVALVLLCASLYFYTRYVASTYSYEVTTDADGVGVFIVRQSAGTRSTTHCRMTLSSLVRAQKLDMQQMKLYRKNRKSKHKDGGAQDGAPEYLCPAPDVGFYDYCVTLCPTEATLLCFRSRMERADLLVEISEEFATVLTRAAEQERVFLEQGEL